MTQAEIENKIDDIKREIDDLTKEIDKYDSIKEESKGVLYKLQDLYRETIYKIKEIILYYSKLRLYTHESYYDIINNYKDKELNYNEKYVSTSEKLYGVDKIDFSLYLQLNNLLFELLIEKRNQVVHHYPNKKLNISDFLNEVTPYFYNKIFYNLDKAIENVKVNLGKLDDNIDNYKRFLDYYEILGDLHIHNALLFKEYYQDDVKRYVNEVKWALGYYNRAIDYGRKLVDEGITYFSYRANNYMEIFNNFFFKDKLGNLKEITDLKEKRDHIEEKFRIWEKLTLKRFSNSPLKGMRDFFPEDMREVNWITEIVREVAELYCYEEYEGPILEPIEIFAAKSSHELIYEQSFYVEKFEDRKIILIPELTPTLARMVSRKSQELKKPIRWYSIPTCFRYEQPQRGRLRSFKQINMDILGDISLYADLEMFNIVVDILTNFGATEEQFQIYYNNRRFIDAVCEFILKVPQDKMPLVYKILDKSDKMEETEFEKYVIDSFQDEYVVQGILKLKESDNIQELLRKFDEIPEEFYESNGYKELIGLENLLNDAGISKYCSFSSRVVRGLDYYTGTVFEVFDTGKENIRAIFGGGRYDDLLSLFSDEQISGIGFGMGVLMLSMFLNTYNLIPDFIQEKEYTDTIYIASTNESVANYAIKLSQIIRKEEFPCIVDYRFKNLKNQLKRAKEFGVLITLIIGPKEMEQNCVAFRNMLTEKQETIDLDELIEQIYNTIENYGDISDDDETT